MRNLKKVVYTIQLGVYNLAIPGVNMYLHDQYTGMDTLIDPDADTRIRFTVNDDPLSADKNRFSLVFKPVTVLPLVFISLKAISHHDHTTIEWHVSNEGGIDHYEIEKSTDGAVFHKIGVMPAA